MVAVWYAGGGEDDLLSWGKGGCVARWRKVELKPGWSCCLGGVDCGGADSIARNASKAAAPPLMMRLCVGPCGEGANWTRHMVIRGGGDLPPWACLWGVLWQLWSLGGSWEPFRQGW